MRRAAMTLATLGLLFAALPAALAQETGDIVITLSGNLFGDPGSTHLVHTEPVPENLIGATCDGFAETENNSSVWVDNILIIESGGSSTQIVNYEAVAGGTTFTTGTVTLGATINLSIQLGPGGVSSEGLLIVLNCAQPEPPTTTTTVAPTTTTEPPTVTTTVPPTVTTQPPTDTTEAPPEGGVEAGGGSTAGNGTNAADAFVGAGVLALAAALGILFVSRQIASKRD